MTEYDMTEYDACEQAYKRGYENGFRAGESAGFDRAARIATQALDGFAEKHKAQTEIPQTSERE